MAATLQHLIFRPCVSQKGFFQRLYHHRSSPINSVFVPSQSLRANMDSSSFLVALSSTKLIHIHNSRFYATQQSKPKPKTSEQRSLAESTGQEGAVTLSLGEKVKENAKTGGYGLVIVAGLVVTGGLLWVILSELFSSESPNNIYTHAFKLCKINSEVQDALGTPIKCYGEESRRGWRRHVSHVEFFQGNTKYLRMKFYIEGPFGKGVVNVEKKQNPSGKLEYTYVLVDTENYPPRRINVHF